MVRNANLHMVHKSLNVTLTNKWPIKQNHVSLIGKKVPALMVPGAISNTKPINHHTPLSLMGIGKLSTNSETNILLD